MNCQSTMEGRREYMKQYYSKNKARAAAQNAERYKNNREAILSRNKAYRDKNKDKLNLQRFANKEAIAAGKRAYCSRNVEKIKAYVSKYRAENKDKIKAGRARYRAANANKISEYYKRSADRIRAYHEKHPEKSRRWKSEYKKAHPEVGVASSAKRRAIAKKLTIGSTATMVAWMKNWRSKRSVRCFWCQASVSPKHCHSDHIIPLSLGGAHSIENLCISCAPCNLKKNRKSVEEWSSKLTHPVLL